VRTARFEAMGCEVVVGGASAPELQAIVGLFRQRDRIFSRFIAGSELNEVNAAAGTVVGLSPLFARALEAALEAARQTNGLVDPTLGTALEAAGYDRDFAELAPDPRPAGPPAPGRWREVRRLGRLVLVPAGVLLDLNGVVKAAAADDALALLSGTGFVSAGGDVAARGDVTVEVPGGEAVRLVRGGLATSGRARRTWLRGGKVEHHLIDPRTGAPADSPWEQVTVAGASCLAADVLAKAAFLRGAEGPAWLDERGVPGRFLAPGEVVLTNRSWGTQLSRAAAA
jgi:thiamine biosynthesis lipoprotein